MAPILPRPKRRKSASSPSPLPVSSSEPSSGSDSDESDLSPPPVSSSESGSDPDPPHSDLEDSFYSSRSSGGRGNDFDQDSSSNDVEEGDGNDGKEGDDSDGEEGDSGDGEEGDHEGGDDDCEMGELEKECRTLQANHQNILKTLKQHRDDDASRGHAVKNQKALWDKTLEMRFLLQKAFSTSNKLPREPTKSRFCNNDKEIEKAYDDLLDSSKQTLGCMLDLQEALLERNQAAKGSNEMYSASNAENDEWSEIEKLQRRITQFRNNEIDKWQRKTQVTTGAVALKGKLHAFNQNVSDQVAGYMRDPSRMINRMYLSKSAVGVFGEYVEDSGNAKEEHSLEGDPELIDDSEFYQQLLKEFLESCDTGASELAFYALRKQQNKKRKLVDRRASKSRKIRYHVHEKIANFMAPLPMVLPPVAPKLFDNLFGAGNQKLNKA